MGDKNYSLHDWNKLFESMNPHKGSEDEKEKERNRRTPGERVGLPFE